MSYSGKREQRPLFSLRLAAAEREGTSRRTAKLSCNPRDAAQKSQSVKMFPPQKNFSKENQLRHFTFYHMRDGMSICPPKSSLIQDGTRFKAFDSRGPHYYYSFFLI